MLCNKNVIRTDLGLYAAVDRPYKRCAVTKGDSTAASTLPTPDDDGARLVRTEVYGMAEIQQRLHQRVHRLQHHDQTTQHERKPSFLTRGNNPTLVGNFGKIGKHLHLSEISNIIRYFGFGEL